MDLEAQQFGLNSRVQLRKLDDGSIAIVKKIKSRIIRKDALKIVEVANKILDQQAGAKVKLICTSNICSKSKQLLSDEGIEVIIEE